MVTGESNRSPKCLVHGGCTMSETSRPQSEQSSWRLFRLSEEAREDAQGDAGVLTTRSNPKKMFSLLIIDITSQKNTTEVRCSQSCRNLT